MAIPVGTRYDDFVVVSTKASEAAARWESYHGTCIHYSNMRGLERLISGACLDDEYEEMKADQYIMGVGLYTYNQSHRRRA